MQIVYNNNVLYIIGNKKKIENVVRHSLIFRQKRNVIINKVNNNRQ